MNSSLDLIDFIDADTQTTANKLFILFAEDGCNEASFDAFVQVMVQTGSLTDFHRGWHCLSSLRHTYNKICHPSNVMTFSSLLIYLQQYDQQPDQQLGNRAKTKLIPLASSWTCSYSTLVQLATSIYPVLPVLPVLVATYKGLDSYRTREAARAALVQNQQIVLQIVQNNINHYQSWEECCNRLLYLTRRQAPDFLCDTVLWKHLNAHNNITRSTDIVVEALRHLAQPSNARASSQESNFLIEDCNTRLEEAKHEFYSSIRSVLLVGVLFLLSTTTGFDSLVVVGIFLHVFTTLLQLHIKTRKTLNASSILLTLFMVRLRMAEVKIDWSKSGIYRQHLKCWEIYQELTKSIRMKHDGSYHFYFAFGLIWISNVALILTTNGTQNNEHAVLVVACVGLLCWAVCETLYPAIEEMQKKMDTVLCLSRFQMGNGECLVFPLRTSVENKRAFRVLKEAVLSRTTLGSGVYDAMTLHRVVQSVYAMAIAFIIYSAFQVARLKVSLVLPFNTMFILGWQIVVQTKERCMVVTTARIERKLERDEKKHSLPSFATLVDPTAENDLPMPSVALIGVNMGLIALSLALSSGS
tara:strand:+ start:634 stop:2382 length:1749 start_codon:yes stop_codon:yes gene_type:complete